MNGAALMRMRRESGLTLEALAAASNTNMGNLSRIERGQRTCTAETLRDLSEALAAALNRPVSEVLEELTEPADAQPA